MQPKWIITMCIMFIGCGLVNGWIEMEYLGDSDAGLIYTIFSGWREIEFTNPLIAVGTVLSAAWTYMKAFLDVLTWNYAFFHDEWEIVRYFFIAISIGVTASLILALRGTGSS